MDFQIVKNIAIATPIDLIIIPLSFDEYLDIEESERPALQAGTTFPSDNLYSPVNATCKRIMTHNIVFNISDVHEFLRLDICDRICKKGV